METERDRLIRTGMLTPFDMLHGFERRVVGGGKASGRPGAAGAGGKAGDGAGRGRSVRAAPWLDRGGIDDLRERRARGGRPLDQLLADTAAKTQVGRLLFGVAPETQVVSTAGATAGKDGHNCWQRWPQKHRWVHLLTDVEKIK